MSKVLCEKSDLVAIADSIRSKTGSTDGMKVAEIPQKIEAIETGSNINIQASKSITYTSNGTATITPDEGYDGLSSVDVTVDVSGGGVETCTLTTSLDEFPGVVHGTIYAYYGDTLITITSKGTHSINKNSLIYINGASAQAEITGLEQLYYGYGESVYNVTSDIATYEFNG